MEGKGIFKWPDGKKYDGEYVNNHKEGTGTMYNEDGSYYKGEWKNGK